MANEPTAQDQYMLELLNRARQNPQAEADRYIDPVIGGTLNLNEGVPIGETISTAAKQPLAFNLKLFTAANKHTQWMFANNTFAHAGVNGSQVWNRTDAEGYSRQTVGENLARRGTTGSIDWTTTVGQQHEDLFIDKGIDGRGHRTNMMHHIYREIGISSMLGSFTSGLTTFNGVIATQNFGKDTGANAFLTGVAYTDLVANDDFYTVGEGLANITVNAVAANGQTFSTNSLASGGYSLRLAAGSYNVTFSGDFNNDGVADTSAVKVVSIGSDNIKQDFTSDTQATEGNDVLNGSANADIISGLGGNDTIWGNAGNDTINGGSGNDSIQGGLGQDSLDGGAGNDTVDYTTFNGNGIYNLSTGTANLGVFTETMLNFENIIAGGGNDTITGTAGENNLQGGAGNDYIQGGFGKDTLDGGAGSDTADYTTFNGNGTYNLTVGTAILTGAFTETMLNFENIITGGGNDTITGNAGANTLIGGAGADTIDGGNGNDTIQGGLGLDILNGGVGSDTADYTTFNGNGTYNLTVGTAFLSGAFTETMLNFESILAGGGNDTITGTTGANTLNGGAGNDTLTGAAGNDNFYFGGAAISATNTLGSSLGNDTITDFTPGQDKIVLSLAAFTNITAGGGLSFASVANDDAAALSSAKIVYNQTSHLLSYKNPAVGAPLTEVGNGGNFATLNISAIGFNLAASDFTLVA